MNPNHTPRINIGFKRDIIKQLETIAEETERTPAGVVRMAVREFLQRHEKAA